VADHKYYFELEHSVHRVSLAGAADFQLNGIGLNAGMIVMPNLAVEGVVGRGTSVDTQDVGGFPVTLKGGNSFAVYSRPFIAVTDKVEVYGRFGYVKAKSITTVPDLTTTDSSGDWSYGTGTAIKFNDRLAVTAGYMVYYNKNGTKADGFNIALRSMF
jgi:hypothetical protein